MRPMKTLFAMIYEPEKHINYENILNILSKTNNNIEKFRAIEHDKDVSPFLEKYGFRVRKEYVSNGRYENRLMTKGEISCAIAHITILLSVLERFENEEQRPDFITIFESDACVSNEQKFKEAYLDAIERLKPKYLKFGWQDLQESLDFEISQHPNFLKYRSTWLAHAYMVSYEFAKRLVEFIKKYGIYTWDDLIEDFVIHENFEDESYLYIDNDLVYQKREFISQTEPNNDKDFHENDDEYGLFCVASDLNHEGLKLLNESIELHHWKYNNTIACQWYGHDLTVKPGGFQKIIEMYTNLSNLEFEGKLKDETIIIHLDAYDTLLNCSSKDLIDTWKFNFPCWKETVTFGVERNCWPPRESNDITLKNSPSLFLNSGCYIGLWKNLKILYEKILSRSPNWRHNLLILNQDDQYAFQLELAKLDEKDSLITLDEFGCLFFNMNDLFLNDDSINLLFDPWSSDRNFIVSTDVSLGARPCVLHANGGHLNTLKSINFWKKQALNGLFVTNCDPHSQVLKLI